MDSGERTVTLPRNRQNKALDIPGKSDIMVSNKEHPAKATKRTRRALCVHQREPPRLAFLRVPRAASGFALPGYATTAEREGERIFLSFGKSDTAKRRAAVRFQTEETHPETLAGTARYSRLRVTPHSARVIRVEPWALPAHPVDILRDGLFCISGGGPPEGFALPRRTCAPYGKRPRTARAPLHGARFAACCPRAAAHFREYVEYYHCSGFPGRQHRGGEHT